MTCSYSALNRTEAGNSCPAILTPLALIRRIREDFLNRQISEYL